MSLSLYETIRRIVQEELSQLRTAELAVVQEIHPHAGESDTDNYACTVRLRDSEIVLKNVPVATQRIGAVAIPAVNELVLIQFVGGDINAPIVVGRLYNDEDRPPPNDADQAILHLPLGAGDDDAVHLELHSGERREMIFNLGGALSIALRDDDPVVELAVDGGKAKVQIDRDGAVVIESQGDIKLKGNQLAVEGNTIKIEASGELKLKGATVNIN